MQPADYLPLVSREHLSEEDHALILQKMVNGNIATKEEIVEALDKDEYNSMTATYFLLAERKLRAQRQHQAELNKQQQQQTQQQQTQQQQTQQQQCGAQSLPSVQLAGTGLRVFHFHICLYGYILKMITVFDF